MEWYYSSMKSRDMTLMYALYFLQMWKTRESEKSSSLEEIGG